MPSFSLVWVIASVMIAVFAFCFFYRKGKGLAHRYNLFISAIAGAAAVGYSVLLLDILVADRGVGRHGLNLIPFWSYRKYIEGNLDYLYVNILNVLLFIPLGFFLFWVFRSFFLTSNIFGRIILTGALLSLSMELLQLMFSRGLAEFDDVFHNTVGTVLGAIIAFGIEWIISSMKKR